MAITEELSALRASTLADIEAAETSAQLETVRVAVLGKSGTLTGYLRSMGQVPKEERAAVGKAVNEARVAVEEALGAAKAKLDAAELAAAIDAAAVDVTLPGRVQQMGTRHLINAITDEISEVFLGLGYTVVHGPEVETDYYNFTALNAPADHPSRSMQDTFYVDRCDEEGRQLPLRPHTSPMQVRYARTHEAPIKIIAPGRTYRVDSDATHSPMFHQVEGLWIGDDVSFTDLKGVYSDFLRRFFETDDLVVRFRPSYFPFTEPSVEVDMMFTSGPRKGKWLEISGAGEVHPNVVRNFGLDPEKHIGFAFGSGLERLTMLRYGIDDLRLFFEGDLRFLRQFN